MSEPGTAPRESSGLLAVAAVFSLGVICGGALVFFGLHFMHHMPHFGWRGGDRGGRMAIERLTRDLDLDARQHEEIRAIIERRHGEIHALIEEARKEIRALLRPDQQVKFDRIRPPHPMRPPGSPGEEPPEPGE
jgi:Spy/CpxP family protein refolding chaperone